MKNTIAILFLLFFLPPVFAQKNALKGHFGVLPTPTAVFSAGIGYERVLADAWSLQLMLNKFGWSQGSSDGPTEITGNAVLEARYHLGRLGNESLKNAFFVGGFVEKFHKKIRSGGEYLEPPPPLTGKRWGMGTGLVLGKNFPLFKLLYLEIVAGAKLRKVHSVDYLGTATQYEAYNSHEYFKFAPRFGLNIGCRF
ncbi:MAG: DUF3575 domain-containing protein [Saprospiraceae bacterium]|nr:DUF3575 domain-containing protein [Saprospiraceae bacterium]